MNRTGQPAKQPKPFGINGQREPILATTPSGDNTASYESGFPPITMTLKSAGGLPPKGQDMNQILYELSALSRWASAGALNSFDSAFSTAISGYPSGAILISDDGTKIYVNTTDSNTTNPNSGGAGWVELLKYLGIDGLATIADVTSGVSKKVVDALTLRTYLPQKVMSPSGYIRIPDVPGGTIIQWGQFNGTVAEGAKVVTLPTPFPNSGRLAMAIPLNSAADPTCDVFAQLQSATTSTITFYFSWVTSQTPANGFQWFAIGY